MPAGLDTATAARSVISRAEQFVARWPGGYGRTLWQRVVMIQDEPADLAIGLWFACAGAQMQVWCPDSAPWVRERDDALMPRLREAIVGREPRLLTHPLDGLQHDNYHRRWGFAYHQTPQGRLADEFTGPIEVVLIDGVKQLARDPAALLRRLYDCTQWSSSIEILPRAQDENVEAVLEAVRREAIAIGFGERRLSESAAGGLSLVRLGAPMSDHPVLSDATIMAHCQARLDVASGLAKGRRILDAGGWAALGAERYLEAGAQRVVNLDVSQDALDLGKSRLGKEKRVKFVRWDLNETPLPFEDEEFDLVVCLEALEHLSRQGEAVAEFFRVLEPGGVLLISVPDHEFESTWERLNQHDNAYHLHVPTREEFEGLLSSFESIRWLRQTDVSGSFVFEERPRSGPKGGRFAVQKQWDARSALPQVIMALCVKAGASGGKSKSRRPPAIVSDLHVYTSQTDRIAQIREDEAALQVSVRKERFDWWTRANVLESQLGDLRAGLDAARLDAEQWRGRVQSDEQVAALRERFDRTQSAIEAMAADLAADRARREEESGRWTEQLKRQNDLIGSGQQERAIADKEWAERIRIQTNVINEAQRQRSETARELRESEQRLSEQTLRVEALAQDLRAATERAEVHRASLQRAEGRLEQLGATITELRESLAAATTEKAELRSALEAAATESGQWRSAAEAARTEATLERERREQSHAELMEHLARLSVRLDDDRRTLLRRIEDLLEQSLDQVDRRCLTVEGKVYDLEDGLDRPAVSPHRNGSPLP